MLGNSLEPKNEKVYSDYKLPAVLREGDEKFPLPKSLTISFLSHPLAVFMVILFISILTFFGFRFDLFDKPEMKPKDIEFVLVNQPEQTPINKHTKFRADRNTRAGGKHDPTRRISEPEPSAKSSSASQKASPPPAPRIVKQMKQLFEAPAPKSIKKAITQQASAPAPSKIEPPKAKLEPPKFAFAKPSLNIPKSFNVPMPPVKRPSTMGSGSGSGPITSAPSSSNGNRSGSGKTSNPAPIMSGGYGHGGKSRGSSSSYGGKGNAGNPGPGNPNGKPGIDAIKEPDFGPYMRELQRRIKANWEPPRGDESKRVVLLFKIAKDGRLLSLKVLKSSTSASADKAALAAVELTAPFRQLPSEYRGADIDIQFTFDYNVFGVGGGRY